MAKIDGYMGYYKIIRNLILSFFLWNVSMVSYGEEEKDLTENVEEEDEEDDDELEPMKELPTIPDICPDLDRAIDKSIKNPKFKEVKVSNPFFRNINIQIETCSLMRDLWHLAFQSKKKNKNYYFDYHGRLGCVIKNHLYVSGDIGFSRGKLFLDNGDKTLDKKYAHITEGLYVNFNLGYVYHFNEDNDVIFAAKVGYANGLVKKLIDQNDNEGFLHKVINNVWVGALVSIEYNLFHTPFFVGLDYQVNYMIRLKKINQLVNYVVPDYGHRCYATNLGFNLFLGYKFKFNEENLEI